MTTRATLPMRALVSHAIGGGWGQESSFQGSRRVAVIRGADFPGVRKSRVQDVPVRWESEKKISSRLLEPGDIILEISGGTTDRPTGRTVYVSEELLDTLSIDAIPASFCRLVRVNRELAEPLYVYYWLQRMYAAGRTWAYQNRSTGIANFQFEYFLDAEMVELPSPTEQRAVANSLLLLEKKIASNRRAQLLAENLVRCMVTRCLETALSSGSPVGTLGDYCSLVKCPARVSDIGTEDLYVGLEHMPRGSIVLDEWSSASSVASTKSRFQAGDILFGKLRPYFKKVGVAPMDGVCSTDILVLRPISKLCRALVVVVASSDALIDSVSAAATGTRMPRASWDDLANWSVPMIGTESIERLSCETEPLLDYLMQSIRENQRLEILRDTLLDELLSGRIHAPVAQVEAT